VLDFRARGCERNGLVARVDLQQAGLAAGGGVEYETDDPLSGTAGQFL